MMNKARVMRTMWRIFRTLTGDYTAKLSTALKMAWAKERNAVNAKAEKEITVHYSVFCDCYRYAGFKTVENSYDAKTKTIKVIVPANDEKREQQIVGEKCNIAILNEAIENGENVNKMVAYYQTHTSVSPEHETIKNWVNKIIKSRKAC